MIHSSLVSDDDFRSGVEMCVSVITNSPSQDYIHPDDRNLLTYDMTPGFKPFTERLLLQQNSRMYAKS